MSPVAAPAPPGRHRALAHVAAATRRLGAAPALAGTWLVLVLVTALAGRVLSPYDPVALDLLHPWAPPSPAHWLGTDESGRDVLSRLLTGTGASVLGPALVVLGSVGLGTLLALVCAWWGGWVDALVARALDVLVAFPAIVVAIAAVSVVGQGLLAPVVALVVAYVPVTAKVLRTAAAHERSLPYVAALRVQGLPTGRIWLFHLVPNLAPVLLVQCVVGASYALLDLAAISYLGLGLQAPDTDWGLLVSSGQPGIIQGAPVQSLAAALVVVATVLSLNVLGDRAARAMEVESR